MPPEPAQYDLIVVGGGIVGTGLAREASLRGLKVALFDKEDLAAGTTSRSTRLIHGGLRYLELFEFGLVHEALRERRLLLRLAPHLVEPIPFLFPVYRGRGHALPYLWAGLALYDVLSLGKHLPRHRMLLRDECLKREPALRSEGLQGGFLYYDAQCAFPERLCVENAVAAAAEGARISTHSRVVGIVRQGDHVVGARVRDEITGSEEEIAAPLIVNAAGPWIDEFLETAGVGGPARLTRSKGIHLVVPRFTEHALIMETEDAKRIFFAIPWAGFTLLGTTDTEYQGENDEVAADADDIDYLIHETARILDVELDRDDILFTTAGLRALPRSEERDVGAITRRHVLVDHGREAGPTGLYSVVGGKITTYRAIAEDVLDRILWPRGRRKGAVSPTRHTFLPGGGPQWTKLRHGLVEDMLAAGLGQDVAIHLVDVYGTRARGILEAVEQDPALGQRLDADHPTIVAEVDHAVENEFARTADDFLLRRTTLGLSRGVGVRALESVVQRMGDRLGWDADRRVREIEAYRRRVLQMAPLAPP